MWPRLSVITWRDVSIAAASFSELLRILSCKAGVTLGILHGNVVDGCPGGLFIQYSFPGHCDSSVTLLSCLRILG